MHAALRGMAETGTAALSAGVITSVLCAAIAMLISRTVLRTHATLRHLCWHGALLMSVVATLVPLARSHVVLRVSATWMPWRESRDTGIDGATHSAIRVRSRVAAAQHASSDAASHDPFDYRALVVIVWLAGATIIAWRSCRHCLAARGLRLRAEAVNESWCTVEFHDMLCRSGYRRPVALLRSVEIDVPCVTGLFAPAVVVPRFSTEWSVQTWRSVAAHEVAHLVRADVWTLMLSVVACTIQWFNPVVWWLAARRARDAEFATDALALTYGIRPSCYADALLSLAEDSVPGQQHAMAFARRNALSDRVHAVLAVPVYGWTPTRRAQWNLLSLCGVVALSASSVRIAPLTTRAVRASSTPRSISSVVATAPRAIIARADVRRAAPHPSRQATRVIQQRATGRRPVIDDSAFASPDWVDDAVVALTLALADPSPQVRMAAAGSLARLRRQAARTSRKRSATDLRPLARGAAEPSLTAIPVQRK